MSRIIADRVRETSTTTGTGTFDLDGAVVGFQGFVAGAGDGAVVYYTIAGQEGGGAQGEWENGVGTITDAATDTLSRDTVLSSSNGGSAVNFSAGTKDVFISVPTKGMAIVVDTASPSSAAQVDFALPSQFHLLTVQGWLKPATDNVDLWVRLSNDGGSTFRSGASDYAWVDWRASSTGTISNSNSDSKMLLSTNTGNAAGEHLAFKADIHAPGDSAVVTSITMQYGRTNDAGDWFSGTPSGRVTTEEANDAVRFLFSSGNIADGELRLTGIP